MISAHQDVSLFIEDVIGRFAYNKSHGKDEPIIKFISSEQQKAFHQAVSKLKQVNSEDDNFPKLRTSAITYLMKRSLINKEWQQWAKSGKKASKPTQLPLPDLPLRFSQEFTKEMLERLDQISVSAKQQKIVDDGEQHTVFVSGGHGSPGSEPIGYIDGQIAYGRDYTVDETHELVYVKDAVQKITETLGLTAKNNTNISLTFELLSCFAGIDKHPTQAEVNHESFGAVNVGNKAADSSYAASFTRFLNDAVKHENFGVKGAPGALSVLPSSILPPTRSEIEAGQTTKHPVIQLHEKHCNANLNFYLGFPGSKDINEQTQYSDNNRRVFQNQKSVQKSSCNIF